MVGKIGVADSNPANERVLASQYAIYINMKGIALLLKLKYKSNFLFGVGWIRTHHYTDVDFY